MANRITEKDMQHWVKYLNNITGNPVQPWGRVGDRNRANIGNYHLSHAYGGVCLHQMSNESGGVRSVFGMGHGTKRDLYDQLRAFIAGIELQQQNEVK